MEQRYDDPASIRDHLLHISGTLHGGCCLCLCLMELNENDLKIPDFQSVNFVLSDFGSSVASSI